MSDKKTKKDALYKILLLGDWSVGKTCFLMRYTENTFTEIHLSTVGIDYKLKNVTLDNNKVVKTQIWDTAGQERYKTITKSYIKGANGIILIYDITNKSSFEGIKNWIRQIKETVNSRVCVALVANKIDKESERVISKDEGEKLANELQYPFYEASAKEGININECFDNLVKQIDINYTNNPYSNSNKLNNKKKETKGGCC